MTTAEAEEGRRLAEVFVKRLTGEATLTAKLMRQDPFEFNNQATFWLSANHKPVIRGMDLAIRRRIKLIPFTVTIPEAERDPRLAEKLANRPWTPWTPSPHRSREAGFLGVNGV